MTEDKKVWVIEQGEYSDYHVVGIFSTKENAERVLEYVNKEESSYYKASIAEMSLDPGVEGLNHGMAKYLVHMHRDGTVEHVARFHTSDLTTEFYVWERSKAPAYRGKNKPNLLIANLWATDEAHAIKITNEKRQQMIAMNKWKETNETQ